MQSLYVAQIVYGLALLFLKISILLLYRGLFPTPGMLRAINAVGVFVFLWELSTGIVDVFPCWPIARYWDPLIPGRCVTMPDFFFGKAIPNINGDFAILILPIRPVWALNITTREKIILLCMFLTGGLCALFPPLPPPPKHPKFPPRVPLVAGSNGAG